MCEDLTLLNSKNIASRDTRGTNNLFHSQLLFFYKYHIKTDNGITSHKSCNVNEAACNYCVYHWSDRDIVTWPLSLCLYSSRREEELEALSTVASWVCTRTWGRDYLIAPCFLLGVRQTPPVVPCQPHQLLQSQGTGTTPGEGVKSLITEERRER